MTKRLTSQRRIGKNEIEKFLITLAGIGVIITMVAKITLKYFKLPEFDSPDLPGSGKNMQPSTLKMLDKARGYAGIPFIVNSGYRTIPYNNEVGGAQNSAHLRGFAIDISTTPLNQKIIVAALVRAGFKRIGIGSNFVHADNDLSLPYPVAWGYPLGNKAPYDPFKLV